MNATRTIFCGGLPAELAAGETMVELDLHGQASNVHLKLSDISTAMAANVPDVLTDLLEVAAYVYSADQAVRRGNEFDDGQRWRRHFNFHVPVRCLDLWSRPEVRGALTDVLSFLSDDDYDFTFHRLTRSQPVQLYLENVGATYEVDEVALFSGGLDSLAGAVQAAIADKRRVALVSHASSPKRTPQVKAIGSELARRSSGRVQHIPVWATKSEDVGREYTQRTRSFLFAAIATTVSRMLGLDAIRFYENGVTSINLPIAPQVVGGRGTRTTHPQSLRGLAKLLSLVLERPFAVESPFLWRTKGDIIRIIKDNGCGDLIRSSVSCSRTVEATRLHTHCGRCSQCIDRRFAALAVGLTDDEDPAEMYKADLMTAERVVGETRTMAESFLRRALSLRTMDDLTFLQTFPEATRVLRHVGLPSEQAARQMIDLHRRHSEEVQSALVQGLRKHAAEFQAGALPDSCVLVLGVPERYRAQQSGSKTPTFRRDGDFWDVWFENESTRLKDGVGPRHLARLLASPGRQVHCFDLLVAEKLAPGVVWRREHGSQRDDQGNVALSPAGSGGKRTDHTAVRSYRVRLDEIELELQGAEAGGETERVLELRDEARAISRHLSEVVDLRGNPRPDADDDERARQAVTKALRRTQTSLRKKHPGLARHLAKHLSTGNTCAYTPEPAVQWATA